MYLINGQLSPTLSLDQALNSLTARLPIALGQPCDIETVLATAERFAARLTAGEFDLGSEVDAAARNEIAAFCTPASLKTKLKRELGEQPFSLRRIDYRASHFEAWRPLGLVVHVTPANAPLLPFFAILESLLLGNVNWLRPSSSDAGINARLLQAFLSCDTSGQLADFIAVTPAKTSELPQLMVHADGVSAWGGDSALEAIRKQLPAGCRWIDWGHKISFAYLVPNAIDSAALDAVADEVCRFDQQACSSPQVVFVDSDDQATLQAIGEQLAEAMARRTSQWPALTPSEQEAADITSRLAFTRLDQVFGAVPSRIWTGEGWRIIWKHEAAIEPSPLFRSVLLRPLPRARLVDTLRPWRTRLQSCGLVANAADMAGLSHALIAAGVGRLAPMQAMHEGYSGEPHDGVYALSRLARRVSVTLAADMLPRQATLDLPPVAPASIVGQPVMDKAAFLNDSMRDGAQLFFRSGGSSGVPKLAGFSYGDYHRQMQAAADGLFAAGIEPASDRVLNLLYAGNLYGGLLSFFTLLDKLGVTHYPMGGPNDDDYSEIASVIVSQKVNTLIGMPSTIYQLFVREEKTLRAYGGIKKLMLGGEHLGASQREFIASFGVTTIRSAIYGSVDAGPLGHACHASPDGVFHLLTDTQWLEIVDTETDQPVAPGESGRLLFTSRAREGQKVVRYEIGDLGRWVDGECACGAQSPRFELQGRHGALIRIGTMFVQPQKLAALAEVPIQLILEYGSAGRECIRLLADGDAEAVRARVSTDPELKLGLDTELLELEVSSRPVAEFERHTHSGKTPLVMDRRR
ncbi:aldehyde dehydrogenase family protein [Parachitinimonas caeni]|uniref:long-chain-fatty-acyl-CoA reductase n=1 Tax=Parachitinimonas caeni TaxID=3031301 RepID=A0ABT7DYM1_9NEIS|nr:aldehyde dehydrogenase family protein [Parachitinimonas caeni]MDK2125166.1 aldehyde dehydrogenase family protein [Parachitinimonas caeni]